MTTEPLSDRALDRIFCQNPTKTARADRRSTGEESVPSPIGRDRMENALMMGAYGALGASLCLILHPMIVISSFCVGSMGMVYYYAVRDDPR